MKTEGVPDPILALNIIQIDLNKRNGYHYLLFVKRLRGYFNKSHSNVEKKKLGFTFNKLITQRTQYMYIKRVKFSVIRIC